MSANRSTPLSNDKMASLIHTVVENYNEALESNNRGGVVNSWLFMSSPLPVIGILLFYLYFVLKLGPEWMEKRPPYKLTKILIAYNAYQVLFSIWLCGHVLGFVNELHLLIQNCNNYVLRSSDEITLYSVAWWYFFSKVVELLDTVFFVLRKKQSQVTFLHVYHHSIMMFFSWAYLKYLPEVLGIIIGFLNMAVHSIMYFYYLLAALGPSYQKYLWWKKYMTWIQLTQFCLMLGYLMYIIAMDCKMPKGLAFFFVGNVVIFLYLFVDFYVKEYRKKATNKFLEHDKKLHKVE